MDLSEATQQFPELLNIYLIYNKYRSNSNIYWINSKAQNNCFWDSKNWFEFYPLPIFPEIHRNIFLDLFEAIFILVIFRNDFWGFHMSPFQIHWNLNIKLRSNSNTWLASLEQTRTRDVTSNYGQTTYSRNISVTK